MTGIRKLGFDDWAKDPENFRGHFEGKDLGTGVTVLFVYHDTAGKGPKLHVHPYDEIFVIRQGRARFTIGDSEIDAGPGDVLLAPADQPHKFVTLPGDPYVATDIHLSPEWIQTDLED